MGGNKVLRKLCVIDQEVEKYVRKVKGYVWYKNYYITKIAKLLT